MSDDSKNDRASSASGAKLTSSRRIGEPPLASYISRMWFRSGSALLGHLQRLWSGTGDRWSLSVMEHTGWSHRSRFGAASLISANPSAVSRAADVPVVHAIARPEISVAGSAGEMSMSGPDLSMYVNPVKTSFRTVPGGPAGTRKSVSSQTAAPSGGEASLPDHVTSPRTIATVREQSVPTEQAARIDPDVPHADRTGAVVDETVERSTATPSSAAVAGIAGTEGGAVESGVAATMRVAAAAPADVSSEAGTTAPDNTAAHPE